MIIDPKIKLLEVAKANNIIVDETASAKQILWTIACWMIAPEKDKALSDFGMNSLSEEEKYIRNFDVLLQAILMGEFYKVLPRGTIKNAFRSFKE